MIVSVPIATDIIKLFLLLFIAIIAFAVGTTQKMEKKNALLNIETTPLMYKSITPPPPIFKNFSY